MRFLLICVAFAVVCLAQAPAPDLAVEEDPAVDADLAAARQLEAQEVGIGTKTTIDLRARESLLNNEIMTYEKVLSAPTRGFAANTAATDAQRRALDRLSEVREKIRDIAGSEHDGQEALTQTRRQLATGDVAAAMVSIAAARRYLGSQNPGVTAAERNFQRVNTRVQMRRYAAFALAGSACLAGLAFLFRGIGFGRGQWVVAIVSGTGAGQKLWIEKERTTIGAVRENNDLAISDQSERLSRVHCEFFRRGGSLFVADRSKNGTALNGKLIARGYMAKISPGSRLDLADVCVLEVRRKRKQS